MVLIVSLQSLLTHQALPAAPKSPQGIGAAASNRLNV